MKKAPALPPICIAVTGDTPQALLDSARRALEYCRFIELRLDWLPHAEKGLAVIPRLLQSGSSGRAANRIILQATCRREESGGRFRGSVAEQRRILRQAIAWGCRVVDLEVESAESAGIEAVESLREQAAVILSWHDFQSTPNLEAAARRLLAFPADYYKLIPTATRQSDNCAALDFLRSVTQGPNSRRWIVFCMEQAGIPSRVLALSRGSALVYASCPPGKEHSATANANQKIIVLPGIAAPGQIDCEALRRVYGAEKLTAKTALYGLLGYPIGHSIGAAIHNAAFRAARLDAVYLPLLAADLKDFRKAAERYPLAGFSVTIPHKQGIFRMLDRVDTVAKSAGAANTVRIRRGRWEGINSDVEGIVGPLRKVYRLSEGERLGTGFRAVVVGSGGAARAALVALRQLRCRKISVTGRSAAKVTRLANELGGTPLAVRKLPREHFDLLIHATPVGMWPHNSESLLRAEQINADTVFDLVYNPSETRLLQLARARGSRTISGLEMFLSQAARQFEYWTGAEAPRRLMRIAAERELARFPQPATRSNR